MLAEFGVDNQNKATLGGLLATGGIAHAEDGPGGRMRGTIRINPDEPSWDPSILVLPHGGDVEIELLNDDLNPHRVLLPSNGDSVWSWLPASSKGTVQLNLDGPGYYWFSSEVGDDEGRGLFGAIVVQDEVPEAGLERTDQPRPRAASASAGNAPAVAGDLGYERILNARSEPQNWLTYYGAYDGQRFSPLNQINTENVERLTPVWMFQFGSYGLHVGASTYAFEAAPVIVDGVMFLSGWDGWVWALDAKTGQCLWQYKHAIPFDVSLCCGNVNRGVAVAQGKVFVATLNAHVLALDAKTGDCLWDTVHGDVRAAENATVAPLVVRNMVIVGSSGGEFGMRGHLDAYDIDTGRRIWRCYSVPEPGEPESDTWPRDCPAWARGGGNMWVTGTYDPELNLLYWGTGNPAPDFDGEVRQGDNRWTDSVIAVDADSGEIRWGYQFTPHDLWDYDSNMESILFEDAGRKLLGHFDKNGYFFVLDRTNGELVRVTPFADRITWGEITPDGETRPRIFPDEEGESVHFWPGPAGAKEWCHAAYNPRTNAFYVPVQDVGSTITLRRREFNEIPYWGASVTVDSEDMAGQVKAIDASTSEEKWRWDWHLPISSSVLTTAGELVFCGTPSGEFNAFDAETGQLLWQFQTGSGHHSSPTTYSVDGRQYIAVPVGWGAWIDGFSPGMVDEPHGDALFVFALPDEAPPESS